MAGEGGARADGWAGPPLTDPSPGEGATEAGGCGVFSESPSAVLGVDLQRNVCSRHSTKHRQALKYGALPSCVQVPDVQQLTLSGVCSERNPNAQYCHSPPATGETLGKCSWWGAGKRGAGEGGREGG